MYEVIETINVPAISKVDVIAGGQIQEATSERLDQIAEGVKHGFDVLVKAQANMSLLAAHIGKGFSEAKAICKTRGRGAKANKAIPTWPAWCKAHGFTDTQADKYIRCAEFQHAFPQVSEYIPSLEDMSNFQKALKHDAKKADGIFAALETDLEDGTEVKIPWNPTCAGEWLAENLQTTKKAKPKTKAEPKAKAKSKSKPEPKTSQGPKLGFNWLEAPTKAECQQAIDLMDDPAGGKPAIFIRKLVEALEHNGIKIPNMPE